MSSLGCDPFHLQIYQRNKLGILLSTDSLADLVYLVIHDITRFMVLVSRTPNATVHEAHGLHSSESNKHSINCFQITTPAER